MPQSIKVEDTPAKGVWRRFFALVPLLVVLVIASRMYIHSVGSTYECFGPMLDDGQTVSMEDVSIDPEGVVEVASVEKTPLGYVHYVFHSLSDGEASVHTMVGGTEDFRQMRVEDGVILDGGIDFSGWESIHVSHCVFLAVATALFASVLVRLWRSSWYGYTMVAAGGGFLFSLFQLAFFTMLLIRGSLLSFSNFASEITYMADFFVLTMMVPIGLLCLLVSVSNISLIRHEGLRPVNLLGAAASVFFVAAYIAWNVAGPAVFDALGSYELMRVVDVIIATAITYGECLLVSTILCALLAAHHVPKHGADYLIILGCGLRPDGTPCPLLAGRVDKALAFDEQRVVQGEKPATFVPSGGKGSDEVMSEAMSMGNYLVQKGVARERIVLEDRSTTTRQNMAFSRKVIEGHAKRDVSQTSVMFSTTNYHVLRGYVCAHQAGMAVEGIGSKTRAYFWPNAFLREFVGLLASKWMTILQLYLAISAIYGIAAYALTL